MGKIKGRWRQGNTREIRNDYSFGYAQGRSGIHLGEVWGPRGDEEIDLLGALNFPAVLCVGDLCR